MSADGYYFGYGSLVNRATRDAGEPWVKATLNGWIRQWAHQAMRPWQLGDRQGSGVCAVTVEARADSAIDGVLVPVTEQGLSQLDNRETGYHRVMLPLSAFTLHEQLVGTHRDSQIILYVSNAENNLWANPDTPLITSYVHCVMAGFRDVYGNAGLTRFMRSTEGWNLPLLDDRDQPLYPRAVELDAQSQSDFDRQLERFSTRVDSG